LKLSPKRKFSFIRKFRNHNLIRRMNKYHHSKFSIVCFCDCFFIKNKKINFFIFERIFATTDAKQLWTFYVFC